MTSRAGAGVERATDYESIFLAAPDGIVIVDGDAVIRELNPAAERMFGYERNELVGEAIEILVPARSRSVHRVERSEYMDHPRTRPMGIGMELTGQRKDGSEFPVEISLSPMRTDGPRYVVAIVHDVTERSRLRAFGAAALQAAEDERQRIARELHDDTAQRLAALLVQLQLASRAESPARRDAMLAEIRQSIEEAADSVRRIARNLRPPVLEEAGVVGAIRAYARTLDDSYGLRVEVEAPRPEPRLARDVELALYRIVQEALANVVRHAGDARARVTMTLDGRVLEVTVADEGRGFELERVDRETTGMGLLGMRERARNAGGELTIDSAPGEGVRIVARLPLEERDG